MSGKIFLGSEYDDNLYIDIPSDFTETPGGRYRDGGRHSGEEFRDDILIPALKDMIKKNKKMVINFDGGYGYGLAWIEEVFSNLIHRASSVGVFLNIEHLRNNITLISNEDAMLEDKIWNFIIKDVKCDNNYKQRKRSK